jgi:S-adenosylmethionine synthetase
MAFIDRFIDSEETYFKRKAEVLEELKNYLAKTEFEKVNVYLNNLDRRGRGIAGLYLTVLGTCADSADCGQVGRGNRVDGLISLSRPAGSEAAAGKNAQSHPGKIYNLLSYKIAREIYAQIDGLEEVIVWLCSQIGRPINQPHVISVQLIPKQGVSFESILPKIKEIIDEEFQNIEKFIRDLTLGKLTVC